MTTPSLALGRALVGRYSIQRLLGIGTTLEAYLAEDLTLNRKVTIQVLLPELARDPQRRRLFRERIVTSATLNHPNLVQVFDGGQENGTIFMVSEYLSGGSLTDLLSELGSLELEEVALLGLDAANALAYAHANGLVHGRLSPDYLIFDADARVRISDMGFAELSDLPISDMTRNEVLYLSPEQAVGNASDPSADVYALALILFQCATGVVPFIEPTAAETLSARVGAPLPVRSDLGTLDMVLAQAALSDARLRLDATQLANRISGLANVAEASTIAEEPWEPRAPTQETGRFLSTPPRNSIGFQAPSPAVVLGGAMGASEFGERAVEEPRRGDAYFPRGRFDPEASAPLGVSSRAPRTSRPPRRRRRVIGILTALILFFGAVGAAAAYKAGLFTSSYTVPSLVGLSNAQAVSLLSGDNFSLTIDAHTASATVPANDIVSQRPSANTSLKSGGVVYVTISTGPNTTTLPLGLVGSTCVIDTAKLKAIGITAQCPSTDDTYSASVPAGRVAFVVSGTKKNPTAVPVGSTVLLQVSKGPAPVTTTTKPGSTTTTTKPGTTTTTTTIAGEGPRAVPNVVGDTQAQVYAAMKAAGLYFSTTGPGHGTSAWKTVVSESPAAGTMVKWHSNVLLTVAE
jgi:serine/threonine-protein kinase